MEVANHSEAMGGGLGGGFVSPVGGLLPKECRGLILLGGFGE